MIRIREYFKMKLEKEARKWLSGLFRRTVCFSVFFLLLFFVARFRQSRKLTSENVLLKWKRSFCFIYCSSSILTRIKRVSFFPGSTPSNDATGKFSPIPTPLGNYIYRTNDDEIKSRKPKNNHPFSVAFKVKKKTRHSCCFFFFLECKMAASRFVNYKLWVYNKEKQPSK